MSTSFNWLTCLVKGHRYDITEIGVSRLAFCDCCGREIFKRASYIIPAPVSASRFTTERLKSLVTPSDISLAGGEGQAKEGREGDEKIAIDAAAAANVIEAINCGRLAATTSHAIARPRKSLGTRPPLNFIFATGHRDFLSAENNDRRYWILPAGKAKS